ENPLAANHRRGPGGIRRHRENTALSEQTAPLIVLAQRDTAKAAAVHVGNSVMLRQSFIQERVVRLQEIEHTAVVAEDGLQKQLRFLAEGLPQIVIEVRKETQVRSHRVQIAQVKPLFGEIAGQVPGS